MFDICLHLSLSSIISPDQTHLLDPRGGWFFSLLTLFLQSSDCWIPLKSMTVVFQLSSLCYAAHTCVVRLNVSCHVTCMSPVLCALSLKCLFVKGYLLDGARLKLGLRSSGIQSCHNLFKTILKLWY